MRRPDSQAPVLIAGTIFLLALLANGATLQGEHAHSAYANSSIRTFRQAVDEVSAPTTTKPKTPKREKCDHSVTCEDGLIFTAWRPFDNISTADRVGRAIIYFIAICYMFLGISIGSDRFMASIEVITSKERNVTITRPSGEKVTFTVQIWNETVSNLTLMALGSSAPEIMLSCIEIFAKDFEAGDLGPNTIVGSAAFNLFMIIAICVWVIPEGEVRRQKHLDVFFVTAIWSVFAYTWLYLILAVVTPGRIDWWEGVITFAFFPLTVATAYIADTKILVHRFLPRKYRRGSHGLVAVEGDDLEMNDVPLGSAEDNAELAAFEKHRREFIEIMKEIHKRNPNVSPERLQQMAEAEMINRGPKSRAFYRVQATRRLTGGGDVIKKKIEKDHHRSLEALNQIEELRKENTARVFFNPGHYTVLENVGTFNAIVTRQGGPPGLTIMVDYRTEDGSANAGADYMPASGTLTFYPDDQHLHIPIEIIDDDVFEEDEHFYIHLSNLRVKTKDGLVYDPLKLGGVPVAVLETPTMATVMILDDDHAGIFAFECAETSVVESNGHAHIKVQRSSGARGHIRIPYKTAPGTARPNDDYEPVTGELEFDDDQTEAFIEVGIVDKEEYERNVTFYIELGEPIWVKKLGDEKKTQERFRRRQSRQVLGSTTAEESASDTGSRRGSMLDGIKKFAAMFKSGQTWLGEDLKQQPDEPEEKSDADDDQIAQLGKPKLGDFRRLEVHIIESKEFHNLIDVMLRSAKTGIVLSTSTWKEQFLEALTVSAGDDDDGEGSAEETVELIDANGELKAKSDDDKPPALPTWSDYLMHFICVPWKIVFAFCPPTEYFGGWGCFTMSLVLIGVLTGMTGDLASHFGCTIGLKDSINAISFVALGTSVPDTFASKVSAVQDPYADNAVGNVTGSNAVNVFLGIGIAWTVAAFVHMYRGSVFEVEAGTLAFSVTIFSIEAFVCIFVLVLRRAPFIGGELGGPMKYRYATMTLFCSLWAIYIGVSALEAYCVIQGF